MGGKGKNILIVLAIIVVAILVAVALMFAGIIPNPFQKEDHAANTNAANISVAPISNTNNENNENAGKNTNTHIPDMNENRNAAVAPSIEVVNREVENTETVPTLDSEGMKAATEDFVVNKVFDTEHFDINDTSMLPVSIPDRYNTADNAVVQAQKDGDFKFLTAYNSYGDTKVLSSEIVASNADYTHMKTVVDTLLYNRAKLDNRSDNADYRRTLVVETVVDSHGKLLFLKIKPA